MAIILGDKNADKLAHDNFGYVLDNDNDNNDKRT
jgi:hypothetical protein